MENLIIKKHYTDDKMVYNEITGQYELALNYVKSLFQITFKDDTTLQKRIPKNSRKIYNFIFYRSYSSNSRVINFLLNETENGRKFLFDVLSEQMEADLQTGYNDLSNQPAVNVANGQAIDRNVLANNQISVDTEQVIENSASYFGGINLLYRSIFPAGLFLLVMQNSK